MNAEIGRGMSSSDIVGSIALGALAVGVLDGLDAVIVWGLRGVGPARVFQGIAAGLLGPEARSLGAPAALLGVAFMYGAARLQRLQARRPALQLYLGSLAYLFLLFAAMAADRVIAA